jgi:S1-C subfamily serine protease
LRHAGRTRALPPAGGFAALLLPALLLGGCATDRQPPLERQGREIAVATDTLPAGSTLPSRISGLLEKTSPSFITMVVRKPRSRTHNLEAGLSRGVSSGSGFIVGPDGLAITAGHVAVAPGYRVSARTADGRIHEGRVIAVQPDNDLALIRLRDFSGRPVVPAADPCLKPGEAVFSLGRPRGSGDTARLGSVKSMHFRRTVRYGSYGYPDAMVLRMATRRGESGGPVFNDRGELVGMVVSTLSANGRPLNLAHAIPLPSIARFYCAASPQCGPKWQRLASMDMKACP